MSKQDPTDQVKFLVSCIGHTTNGRPDFQAVATELGIVSKAAAQKRYERMLKANGVTASRSSANNGNNGSDEKSAPKVSPTKRKANPDTKAKKSSAKKAKPEPSSPTRSETPVKSETKDEEDEQMAISDASEPDGGHEAQ